MPSKASSPSTAPALRKRVTRKAVAASAAPAVDVAMDEEVPADEGGEAGTRLTQASARRWSWWRVAARYA
jgi:hypothetical protein